MKLLNRTQGLFLWAAAPVFALAGVAMYFAFRYAFNDFADEKLSGVRTEIETYVGKHDTLPVFFQNNYDRLDAAPIPLDQPALPAFFSDTLLFDAQEAEMEPFRRLSFPVRIQGRLWRVSISQSALEGEDLALTIALLLAVLFALLFGVSAWVNRRVSRQVWQPFFNTLDRMRRFSLTDAGPLRLDETPVDEFRELHRTLEVLAEKLQRDFQTVKQFTENASHELQTPLAVLKNKVELLLQDPGLTEKQLQQLHIIGQSAGRMARLNQSLLLLAKIENDQFAAREPINLKPLVEKRLDWLEDFIAEKQLAVSTTLATASLEINPFLADTLLTNLLSNAVKFNRNEGILDIRLDRSRLLISNTGEPPDAPPASLTRRFSRGNSGNEGLGLGLAIVKEICDKNGLGYDLSFKDGIWQAALVFPAQAGANPGSP